MRKLNVLQLNKFYYPQVGGVERVVQQIAEGLCERVDMKVLACVPKGRGGVGRINDVEVHKAGSFGTAFSTPLSLQFFSWLYRLRKDRDILHIHMPFPLADVALWLYGFKGKVAVWYHADIVKQKRLLFFYKPFMRCLLQRADVILVATKGHIDGSDYLPEFQEKCVIIPFGADPELVKKSEAIIPSAKNDANTTSFLTVGRLIYYKGYDLLIKAFAQVPDSTLTIIGDGPLEQGLRKQASELGIEDRVIFRNRVGDDQLAQAFADCDVFVLSSIAKSEAFGLVQIEAMAYGKPVINTNLPSGVPHVSLDGITGITVPPNDADALAVAMNTLVQNAELRQQYGQAARMRVQEEFSMDKMLDRVMDVYNGLMEQTV